MKGAKMVAWPRLRRHALASILACHVCPKPLDSRAILVSPTVVY